MNTDTKVSRSSAYADRMRTQGFIQTKVWIPVNRLDDLKSIAKTMRENENVNTAKESMGHSN